MILSTKPLQSFCMNLKAIKLSFQGDKKRKTELIPVGRKSVSVKITTPKDQVAELLFENCTECKRIMSAVPQGVFAARKIRENKERIWLISEMNATEGGNENKGNYHSYTNAKPINQSTELTPLKYNSKLMNSIWGLYNRYSVHNFKKNTDSKDGLSSTGWRAPLGPLAPQNPVTPRMNGC
ncbi:uncharacterized protein [Neodiprion pinetum]|uniref:uncharacterized protein n=1 Tax=Neodiprion pinetum TaxID=441929 RepID=UPI001EE027D3|nr:uncharacterized protein LOC124223752 [Neodiprion pinetum]